MSIFEITLFGITIAPKWYGAMYALGFFICYQFVKKWGRLSLKQVDSLLLYVFFGVVLGGRLGYVFFYNLDYYLQNFSQILHIWEGGMSFHGGLLGVICSLFLFSRKYSIPFFSLSDTLAIIVPIAIGLGRIGNYINGELLGYSPYSGPFAMMQYGVPHFPSPLLEMLLEGILLFVLLLGISWRIGFYNDQKNTQKNHASGLLSAIFLISYGVLRLIAEQFRLPDLHIGYLWGTTWITLGMVYTLITFIFGIFILLITKKKQALK